MTRKLFLSDITKNLEHINTTSWLLRVSIIILRNQINSKCSGRYCAIIKRPVKRQSNFYSRHLLFEKIWRLKIFIGEVEERFFRKLLHGNSELRSGYETRSLYWDYLSSNLKKDSTQLLLRITGCLVRVWD